MSIRLSPYLRLQSAPYCIVVSLYNAYKGRMDKGYAFAGSNAYKSDRINTVKEVMDDLVSKFENAKQAALTKLKK